MSPRSLRAAARGCALIPPVATVLRPARASWTPATPRKGPVLVLGLDEIGSAVAHRLFAAGYAVALHDEAAGSVLRRGMSFADAAAEGFARLEGIGAQRLHDPGALPDRLRAAPAIPVLGMDAAAALTAAPWRVIVDARPGAHPLPEVLRGLAPLTIGVGPGFVAGETTDVVVETLPALPHPNPQHAAVLGAPMGGLFRTLLGLGRRVPRGKFIGMVGNALLWAPHDGVLTGLLRNGTPVTRGTRLAEVDPRGDAACAFGIAPHPRRVAEGVLHAIEGAGPAAPP